MNSRAHALEAGTAQTIASSFIWLPLDPLSSSSSSAILSVPSWIADNVARTWRGMERAFTSLTGDYRRGMAKALFKAAVTDKTTGRVLYERLLPFGIHRPIGLEPFHTLKTRRLGVLADFSHMTIPSSGVQFTIDLDAWEFRLLRITFRK